MSTVRAIAASEPGPATLQDVGDEFLGQGDVTIAVKYSSLNYKDGLAVTGTGKILHERAGKRHLLERKSSKLTRRLTGTAELAPQDAKKVKKLLGS